MKTLVLISLVGAAYASGIVAAEGEARVQVHATDAFGSPIADARIRLSGSGMVVDVKQDEAISVPYGMYTVTVRVPGFQLATVAAQVDQPGQIILVGLRLGAVDGPVPACSVVGSVSPAKGVTRVRILQMFGSYVADVPLNSAGSFRFQDLECGKYVVIVMAGANCVGTRITTAQISPQHLHLAVSTAGTDACTTAAP
jgi:hypothetical protein